jgi:hypothetical protein
MSRENVELVRGLIAPSETDFAALVRSGDHTRGRLASPLR